MFDSTESTIYIYLKKEAFYNFTKIKEKKINFEYFNPPYYCILIHLINRWCFMQLKQKKVRANNNLQLSMSFFLNSTPCMLVCLHFNL